MGDLLVGLDIGTTNVKAAAFTPDGRLEAVASVPTPTVRLEGGGAEYDPEGIWQGALSVLRQVAQQVGGARVAGIAVGGMAEAGLLVDDSGQPLGPAIAWFDPRTRPQTERLASTPGVEAIYSTTGQAVQTKFSLTKILWWKENHPEIYTRAARWLCMMDWIIFRLTGEQVTVHSLAVRTMAYDMQAQQWAIGLLEQVGVSPSLFPRILPAGSVAGGVRAGVAAEAGLPANVPVVTGGHDHPVATLAAGVTRPGILLDSTGTAEAVIGALMAPRLSGDALGAGLSNGVLPPPGLYCLQGGLSASGGSLEWFKREIAADLDYPALVAAARSAGEGPTGVAYLPHLAGGGPPNVDPGSRGAFVGLTYGHGRPHLVKAVLEGTVCEVRLMVEAMERLTGAGFEQVIVTGGHTRNPVWMQLRADILGRPVTVSAVDEATLLGCALLAGVGAGLFPSVQAAVAQAGGRTGAVIEPRPEISGRYDEFFRHVYSKLYAALAPVYRGMDSAAWK